MTPSITPSDVAAVAISGDNGEYKDPLSAPRSESEEQIRTDSYYIVEIGQNRTEKYYRQCHSTASGVKAKFDIPAAAVAISYKSKLSMTSPEAPAAQDGSSATITETKACHSNKRGVQLGRS